MVFSKNADIAQNLFGTIALELSLVPIFQPNKGMSPITLPQRPTTCSICWTPQKITRWVRPWFQTQNLRGLNSNGENTIKIKYNGCTKFCLKKTENL